MVQTKDGLIALRRLQVQQKKALPYREFANGMRDLVGAVRPRGPSLAAGSSWPTKKPFAPRKRTAHEARLQAAQSCPSYPRSASPRLPVDLRKIESFDKEHYRVIAYGLGAVIVAHDRRGLLRLLPLASAAPSRRWCPTSRSMELAQALVKLQEKELYPRVSLRFTDEPHGPRARSSTRAPRPAPSSRPGAASQHHREPRLRRRQGREFRGPGRQRGEDPPPDPLRRRDGPCSRSRTRPSTSSTRRRRALSSSRSPCPRPRSRGPTQLELVVSRGPEKAQVPGARPRRGLVDTTRPSCPGRRRPTSSSTSP